MNLQGRLDYFRYKHFIRQSRCTVEECETVKYKQGYCEKHYPLVINRMVYILLILKRNGLNKDLQLKLMGMTWGHALRTCFENGCNAKIKHNAYCSEHMGCKKCAKKGSIRKKGSLYCRNCLKRNKQ